MSIEKGIPVHLAPPLQALEPNVGGIVLVLLGRRILDGKPGVSGRRTSPRFTHPSYSESDKAATSNLCATKQVSGNENVHHRQTYLRRDTGITPSVTSHTTINVDVNINITTNNNSNNNSTSNKIPGTAISGRRRESSPARK